MRPLATLVLAIALFTLIACGTTPSADPGSEPRALPDQGGQQAVAENTSNFAPIHELPRIEPEPFRRSPEREQAERDARVQPIEADRDVERAGLACISMEFTLIDDWGMDAPADQVFGAPEFSLVAAAGDVAESANVARYAYLEASASKAGGAWSHASTHGQLEFGERLFAQIWVDPDASALSLQVQQNCAFPLAASYRYRIPLSDLQPDGFQHHIIELRTTDVIGQIGQVVRARFETPYGESLDDLLYGATLTWQSADLGGQRWSPARWHRAGAKSAMASGELSVLANARSSRFMRHASLG